MATDTGPDRETDGRVPDAVEPKIPLRDRFPPTLTVIEHYGDQRSRETYGVHPFTNQLPPEAAKALLRFTGVPEDIKELDPSWIPGDVTAYPDFGDGDPTVWMCKTCAERDDQYGDRGYLTQQEACKTTEYRTPTCSHSWEEETHTGSGLGLDWGESDEVWGAKILINGDTAAPTAVDRERELVVSEYPEWDYTADPLDTTTVSLPEAGTTTLTAQTNGKEWTATVTVDDTVTVDWERTLPGGDTLTGQTNTRIRERECPGTSFKKVYPKNRVVRDDDYLPLPEMDASEFPNHPSHFGRMVNDDGLTGQQMTEQVADALMESYHDPGQ